MRRPLAALCLVLAAIPAAATAQQSWGAPVAQSAPARVGDADIFAMIDEGMAALTAGDLAVAYERFTAANAITFERDDFGLTAQHLPNLALARYAMTTEDWDELGRFAASVATALDVDGYRDHPYRIEAMAFQGVVAYFDDRMNEADLILRAAFAATEGRDELFTVRDLAGYYLAQTAYETAAPDKIALIDGYLSARDAEDGWIKPELIAHLYYIRFLIAHDDGADPGELAALYGEFLDLTEAEGYVGEDFMSFYRGFLGKLLVDAGQLEQARDNLLIRHRHMVSRGDVNDEFLFNLQRLTMAQANLGMVQDAYDYLSEMIAFAQGKGLKSEIYAILYRDLGSFQADLGNSAQAQTHFRAAYAHLRRTRDRSDTDVRALRPLIDPEAPGFDDFAFADELRALAEVALMLADDGLPVLEQFFQGRYLNLDAQLGALNAEGRGEERVFLINRALFFALSGYRDRALRDLDAAGDGAMADLVALVARVWGADADPAAALPTVARLTARIGDLDPARQSAAQAMIAFTAFRQDDTPAMLAAIERWRALPVPDPGALWHRFATAAMVEMVTVALDPAEAAAISDAFAADIADAPDMGLLADYARVSVIVNGQDTLAASDVEVELGGILRRMQARLPPHHALISVTQFALSQAFQWRGEMEQALVWLDRTTSTLRRHPFHNRDVLAYALSEQARLMIELGRTDQAALIAREAYEMVDPQTGRPGVVSAVVGNFAYAILSRTADYPRVAEIYARHLNDPLYADRIPPLARMRQLLSYADALSTDATWETVRDVLDRAQAALPAETGQDLRGWQATIDWTRAIAEYHYDQPAYGYHKMKRSNDMLAALQDDLRAAGGVEVSRGTELRNRAIWTALIGWEHAQTLPQ